MVKSSRKRLVIGDLEYITNELKLTKYELKRKKLGESKR